MKRLNSLLIISTFFLGIFCVTTIFAADGMETGESQIDVEEIDKESTETILDDHTKLSQNIYFDLTLERGPQSAFGQYVPYTLTVTPHLDSPKTQILWNTPTTIEAYPKHEEFVSLEKDQTYVFEGRIKPLRGGIFDFSISVIAWQYNTNYTTSIADNVVFNDNLVFQPVSSNYQWMNVLKFGLLFVGFAIAVVAVIIVVKKYTKKAKKWLTPPGWESS